MIRRFLGLTPLLLIAAFIAGCGKNNSAGNFDNVGADGEKLMVWRVGNGSEPQDLDPQTVTGVPEHKLIMALFEGLVAEDPQDLHTVPGLAESWEISEDGLVYTFHLRPAAKW